MKRFRTLIACCSVVAACSGDSTGPGNTAPSTEPKATTVSISGGNSQEGAVGTALGSSVVATVTDQNGKAMGGVPVQFAVTKGGGSVSPSSATTDANGTASTTWTLGTTAGEQRLEARVQGLTAAPATAKAQAGPIAKITLVSGEQQIAIAGDSLRSPIAFKAADQYGNPTAGATITFTAGGTAPLALSATSAKAGADGLVQVTAAVPTAAQMGQALTLTATAEQNSAVKGSTAFYARRPVLLYHRETSAATMQLVALDWLSSELKEITRADEYALTADIAPDGSAVAVAVLNGTTQRLDLVLIDLASQQRTTLHAGADVDVFFPRFSPSGELVTFTVSGELTSTVGIINIRTGEKRLDATGSTSAWSSALAPDGSLFFSESTSGQLDLRRVPPSGGTPAVITNTGATTEYTPTVSPNGTRLIFTCAPLDANLKVVQDDLCVAALDGTDRQNIIETPTWSESEPTVSYDSKFLAFGNYPASGSQDSDIAYAPTSGGDIKVIVGTTTAEEMFPAFGIMGWDAQAASAYSANVVPAPTGSSVQVSEEAHDRMQALFQMRSNLSARSAVAPKPQPITGYMSAIR